NYDFTAQLPSVRVPTLALRGAEDPDGTEKAMRQLAKLVPGARYEQIPNANHFCNVDQPDAFNRLMMGWLDKQRKLTLGRWSTRRFASNDNLVGRRKCSPRRRIIGRCA